jgi:hypothetical protein
MKRLPEDGVNTSKHVAVLYDRDFYCYVGTFFGLNYNFDVLWPRDSLWKIKVNIECFYQTFRTIIVY